MGEGHFGKAYFSLGPLVNILIKSIGPSYNKDQLFAAAVHLLLKEIGEFNRTKLSAFFIQQVNCITRFETIQYLLTFFLFQGVFRQIFTLLKVGNNLNLEREIAIYSVGINVY